MSTKRHGLMALIASAAIAAPVLAALPAAAVTPSESSDTVTIDFIKDTSFGPIVSTVEVAPHEVDSTIATLNAKPDVRAASEEQVYQLAGAVPNDPDYSYAANSHLTETNVPTSWPVSQGEGVIVAVLDTGVSPTHVDTATAGMLLPQINLTSGTNVGFHGTAVASIIAARMNDSVGTVGVAPLAKILPIRVCDTGCSTSAMAQGIYDSIDAGAKVINMSIAGTGESAAVTTAIADATAAGVTVVVASGNDGTASGQTPPAGFGTGNPVMYPGASANVVSVSSATASTSSPWAVHHDYVDLSAPGNSTWAAYNYIGQPNADTAHGGFIGTSFAAPQVAGAAANVIAANPDLTPAQVESILKETTNSPGASWAAGYGTGLLNVGAAVTQAASLKSGVSSLVAPVSNLQVGTNNQDATISWNDDVNAQSWKVLVDGEVVTTTPSTGHGSVWVSVSNLAAGPHTVSVSGVDVNGLEGVSATTTFDTVIVAPMVTPANLSATPDNGSILLNWDNQASIHNWQVRLDGMPYGISQTNSFRLTNLTPGAHTASVEAIGDDLRRSDAASTSFDVAAPIVVTPPTNNTPVVTPPVDNTPPTNNTPVVTPPTNNTPVVTPPVSNTPVVTPPVTTPPVSTPVNGPVVEKDGSKTYTHDGVKANVKGEIAKVYESRGADKGQLGFPTQDAFAVRDGGVVQRFEKGLIYSSATGTHEVLGNIESRYSQIGWENSRVGYPASSEIKLRDGGVVQRFEKGLIYSSAKGTHEVLGAIESRYAQTGWENGTLGYPASSEIKLRDGGVVQRFEKGLAYWTPQTGAQIVKGSIESRYAQAGWENSELGYPTTSETAIRGGAFNHFQGGSIYWSPSTGAQVVKGAIRDAWGKAGWENSKLGYPKSGEYAVPGGMRQDFQNGSLTWNAKTGKVS